MLQDGCRHLEGAAVYRSSQAGSAMSLVLTLLQKSVPGRAHIGS